MNIQQISSLANRGLFVGAFVLLALAVVEWVTNLAGYTLLRGVYSAGRLMEFAAILLIFVITLLLRQMRDEVKKGE